MRTLAGAGMGPCSQAAGGWAWDNRRRDGVVAPAGPDRGPRGGGVGLVGDPKRYPDWASARAVAGGTAGGRRARPSRRLSDGLRRAVPARIAGLERPGL